VISKSQFKRLVETNVNSAAACGAATGFLSAIVTLLLTSIISSGQRFRFASTIVGASMPSSAMCLRASRKANYASVWVPIGTPVRLAELLVRLDNVVSKDDNSVWIVNSIVSQSDTLTCNSTSNICTDVAHISYARHPNTFQQHIVSFRYVETSMAASMEAGLSVYTLNLKGEMNLVEGYTYWMTTTHLCWSESKHSVHMSKPISINNGRLYTTSDEWSSLVCNASQIMLFPVRASHEIDWLSIPDRYLYENDQTELVQRRLLAENGIDCASKNYMHSPYLLDCSAQGSCHQEASLPYRRLISSAEMVISIKNSTYARMAVWNTNTLTRIPDLMNPDDAFLISTMRLLLMILAATITYIRSAQESSDSEEMLKRALNRIAPQDNTNTKYSTNRDSYFKDVAMDASIGLVAIITRYLVITILGPRLRNDGNGIIVTSEIFGSVFSTIHFALRNCILKPHKHGESPLTKLGGSMAIIDISCSILVAFSDTPLFQTTTSFSAIGRMLSSILIVVTCSNLAVFGATSCSMIACALPYTPEFSEVEDYTFCKGISWAPKSIYHTKRYRDIVCLSTVLWLLQIGSLFITLSRAFVSPFKFMLTRMSAGSEVVVSLAVVTGMIALGLPMQSKIVREFVSDISTK